MSERPYTLLGQTAENHDRFIVGTFLVGHIEATLDDLRQIIGNECRYREGPIQASWWLEFPDGTVATIYDYKQEKPPEELLDWSVGGHDRRALDAVRTLLRAGA